MNKIIDNNVIEQIEIYRKKLLDLSMGNSLLNFKIGNNKKAIRIVNYSIYDLYNALENECDTIGIFPLKEQDTEPKDEKTEKFRRAYAMAQLNDDEYLEKLKNLEENNNTKDNDYEKLERELKNKVRKELQLPPFRQLEEIPREKWAVKNGINPIYELELKNSNNNKIENINNNSKKRKRKTKKILKYRL